MFCENDMGFSCPVKGGVHDETDNIFIVANRLPVEYDSKTGWRGSPGGLVSALEPALQNINTTWVGWRGSPVPEGSPDERLRLRKHTADMCIAEIRMTQEEVNCFYDGVCNAALWPLYHDAPIDPVFCDDEFKHYRGINQRFADQVADRAQQDALVWVHDYHLQLVPALLREARPDLCIGFFLHVPFPSPSRFDELPWKKSIMRGLLGANLIGFQTSSSLEHFIEAACISGKATCIGRTLILDEPMGKRRVAVDVFPVGPDSSRYISLAAKPEVRASAAKIVSDFNEPELILLGVDRLDYTKGIDVRIRAVTDLLKSEPFKERDIQFIQVAMPSRSNLLAYQELRRQVEETLSLANAELLALGLRPIHYIYDALSTEQVIALYVAADVMLVTSLADGMNLVSKEFIACQQKSHSRLVLSSTTGAATQLREAWLVDPFDVEDLKRGISEAISACADEARDRMARLSQTVASADAKHWVETFLARLREAE
jgi:alpha,alpha-trehalose-phosphate synthase [UDP-forming]